MSEAVESNSSPFSGTVVALLVAIGLVSFTAAFALMGWAPDLANKDRAGEHPYSTSAIGYQGLVRLLEADGMDVSITRTAESRDFARGLLVVTVPRFGFNRLDGFDVYDVSQPVLYVLPKWLGRVDRSKRSWHEDTSLLMERRIQSILERFDDDASVSRFVNNTPLTTPFGRIDVSVDETMQVIKSKQVISIVTTPEGSLLSRIPETNIYILSDPDMLNTFGLARPENARFALGLFDYLQPYQGAPIAFDATVHGFERTSNLLRIIFDIPFLGATLIAFATMLLVGWGATVRFAPSQQEGRVIAFGKQALADNSAGLIAMTQRENTMAPRYLETSRRALRRQFGLPKNTDPETLTNLLNALTKQREGNSTFETNADPLEAPALNREDLTEKAQRLWRWRKEMSDGH